MYKKSMQKILVVSHFLRTRRLRGIDRYNAPSRYTPSPRLNTQTVAPAISSQSFRELLHGRKKSSLRAITRGGKAFRLRELQRG